MRRRRPDSNRRTGLCRPLPSHSATSPRNQSSPAPKTSCKPLVTPVAWTRTGVRGCAGLCLTTRPPRRSTDRSGGGEPAGIATDATKSRRGAGRSALSRGELHGRRRPRIRIGVPPGGTRGGRRAGGLRGTTPQRGYTTPAATRPARRSFAALTSSSIRSSCRRFSRRSPTTVPCPSASAYAMRLS